MLVRGLVLSLLVSLASTPPARAQCSAEKFLPPYPTTLGEFGDVVALDANWLAVGQFSYAHYAGAVHVYSRPAGSLHATLQAFDAGSFAYFGSSLALRDGLVAAGAPKALPLGRAYLFDAAQGRELFQLDPIGSVGAMAAFGATIDLGGGLVAVGAPGVSYQSAPDDGTVHVFDALAGAPRYRLAAPEPSDFAWAGVGSQFGYSLALDGDLLLVGAPFAGIRGGAYVYDAASGALLHRLQPPGFSSEFFGGTVELVGTRAYVRSSGNPAHSVSAYDARNGTHLFDLVHPFPLADLGLGANIGGNASFVAVGASSPYLDPAVHLFSADTGAWVGRLSGFPAGSPKQFGISLAVHGDGIAVGDTADSSAAPSAGAAYLFELWPCR